MNLAPVALFLYNRPKHAELTLNALKENKFANETKIFIFCDGPKLNATNEDLELINQTRHLAKTFSWEGEKKIIEINNNKGLARSIIDGVSEILTYFDKIIIVEDDLVTGKGFLKYMNEALKLYENSLQVISIHAYNYPIHDYKLSETFFLRGADCWGWATWRRGWELFEEDGEKLYQQIIKRKLSSKFDLDGAIKYTNMLREQINGYNDSWAIRWHASAFLLNKLTLYPVKSLVKNIGLDGSGTHGELDKEKSIAYEDYCPIDVIPIIENKFFRKKIIEYVMPKSKRNAFSLLKKTINSPFMLLKFLIGQRSTKNHNYGWSGDYNSWEDAKEESSGYDSKLILDKCQEATLKVKNGFIPYERDSVTFDKIEYSWPLLSSILKIAGERKNKLKVVDFGGSLGSTYYQNRDWLKHIDLEWIVVEQAHFVKIGSEEFEDSTLKFVYDLNEALNQQPDIVLLSSVLQYLEEPYKIIETILSYDISNIILERTGIVDGSENDILTLQKVPEEIYLASYPCWFFNENNLLNPFLSNYNLIIDYPSYCEPSFNMEGINYIWKGYYFSKH